MLRKSLMAASVISFASVTAPAYAQYYQDYHSYAAPQNQRDVGTGTGGNKAAYERMMQSMGSRSGDVSGQPQMDAAPSQGYAQPQYGQPQGYVQQPYPPQMHNGYAQPQYAQPAAGNVNGQPYSDVTKSTNAMAYDRMMTGDRGYEGRAANPGQVIDSEMSHQAQQSYQQQLVNNKERTALRGRSGLFVPEGQAQQYQQNQQNAERGYDSSYRPVNNSQTQDTTRWR